VHVVVNVLSCDSCTGRLCVLFGTDFAGILELCSFPFKAFSDVRIVAVLNVSVLYTAHVVGVFFGEDLSIFDWLN
jgi:ABC-type Fe3+ transport system permease subunit